MSDLYFTNTLTRKKEKFVPIDFPSVRLYTCGMTVYDYAHIGHGRKYVGDDILKRLLNFSGYKVKHVQNVTDVGHLSSDADSGEDKMEKGAGKFGKTVWEVAEYFTKDFYESMDKLNIIRPDIICKATENISEQIELIKKLVEKGYGYDTAEAVYFDISKFTDYGSLFGQKLSEKEVAVRSEVNTGEYKKNPADFSLWFKRVGRFSDHIMHWDSPWGDGFPGWHIECSAMSIKYLGEQIDIHTGGEDHISIHHPNEIAQSEAATGKKPFSRFWIHYAFLLVDGKKMSKSLGNFYRVQDVEEKGFDPLALRYLYLTAHYREPLNFTWESLQSSQNALNKLKGQISNLKKDNSQTALSSEKQIKIDEYRGKFVQALSDDLNTPQALATLWEMLKSNLPSEDKYDLAILFDEVLGLGLNQITEGKIEIPDNVNKLVKERESLRKEGNFIQADKKRDEIKKLSFELKDTSGGTVVFPVQNAKPA